MCDDPCLNYNEFETEEENNIQCDTCNIGVHWHAVGKQNRLMFNRSTLIAFSFINQKKKQFLDFVLFIKLIYVNKIKIR